MSGGEWVHIRSPFVYWSQTENTVSLRVEIRNAQNPKINIEESKVVFNATGRGAHGESEYHFELDLPHVINPKASTYRVLDRDVDILLKKEEKGWWSKVITSNKKPAWLKVDFDRWKSPDDEDELPQDVMKDFPDIMEQMKREEFGYKIENLRNVYLFLYNFFQFVGYLYIVGVLAVKYLREGDEATYRAYDLVGFAICYCQLIQFLEILHPLLGFTNTGVTLACMQIGGRAIILFFMIRVEQRIQVHPSIFYLFWFWSMAEIIRYPYYMLQISNTKVYLVTWIRYSAWVLLYPLGFLCEGIVIYNCISYFVETGKYSVSLPNSWNMTFYFPAVMRIYLLFGLFPVLYTMMMSMKRSRKKVLGSTKVAVKKE